MAWPGLELALQWAACAAILGWALWHVATRLVTVFKPEPGGANCHGCAHCSPDAADRLAAQSSPGNVGTAPPAAKLKSG